MSDLKFLQVRFFGNRFEDYLFALTLFLFSVFALRLIHARLLKHVKLQMESGSAAIRLRHFALTAFREMVFPVFYATAFYFAAGQGRLSISGLSLRASARSGVSKSSSRILL